MTYATDWKMNLTILIVVLTAVTLSGSQNSYADEPLAKLLRENPTADRQFGLIRKGFERQVAIVTAQRDSVADDLWEIKATLPAKRSVFDSFEVGVIAGVSLVILTIFVLDAQLE